MLAHLRCLCRSLQLNLLQPQLTLLIRTDDVSYFFLASIQARTAFCRLPLTLLVQIAKTSSKIVKSSSSSKPAYTTTKYSTTTYSKPVASQSKFPSYVFFGEEQRGGEVLVCVLCVLCMWWMESKRTGSDESLAGGSHTHGYSSRV